ncbi:MAG: ComF family protein [Armatimonadetes bacterium]|nr:ComF family protein [Armatimonadota bacterium]
MWQWLRTLFFPVRCIRCGLYDCGAICRNCLTQLPRFVPPLCSSCGTSKEFHYSVHCIAGSRQLNRVICVSPYAGNVRAAIQKLKYRRPGNLGETLGEFMVEYARSLGDVELPDVVVPVPLHPQRERKRGYNQAVILGAAVAAGLGAQLDTSALSRKRDTFPQWRLSRRQRGANVRGAFACGPSFSGAHVLLVDDIITTSATVNECASVLRRAGAKRVDAFALARDLVLDSEHIDRREQRHV